MKGVKNVPVLVLLCSVILASCDKSLNMPGTTNIYVPDNSLPPYYTHVDSAISAPPVEITKVSFNLENLESYLTFDKDGLTVPEIKALFQEDLICYETSVNKGNFYPEFYLVMAEYDLNDDSVAEFIIKRPDCERTGGNYFDEGILDVVCHSDGELKRLYTDNKLPNVYYPVAILSTSTNGFRDFALNSGSSYKSVYNFSGTYYEEKDFDNEKSVTFDRFLSSADINAELDDNIIKLRYNFRMFINDAGMNYQFFIAGLFTTAERNGIIESSRLWACNENGEPKLFSTTDTELWLDVLFFGEYAGADLSLYTDDLIWMDEVEIIIYQP